MPGSCRNPWKGDQSGMWISAVHRIPDSRRRICEEGSVILGRYLRGSWSPFEMLRILTPHRALRLAEGRGPHQRWFTLGFKRSFSGKLAEEPQKKLLPHGVPKSCKQRERFRIRIYTYGPPTLRCSSVWSVDVASCHAGICRLFGAHSWPISNGH